MKKLFRFYSANFEIFRCIGENYNAALTSFIFNFEKIEINESIVMLKSFEFLPSGLKEIDVEGFLINIDKRKGCFQYCPVHGCFTFDSMDIYKSFCEKNRDDEAI